MKTFLFAGLLAMCVSLPVAAQAPAPQPQGRAAELPWAFAVADKVQPPAEDPNTVKKVPGSDKSYTAKQVDDGFGPPDWFPSEHPAEPQIISHGEGSGATGVRACSLCHLASGQGHPESGNLAGLNANYILRELNAFKTGTRINGGAMIQISKGITEPDAKAAADWFAGLKRTPLVKVQEAKTVPKTWVNGGRMRLVVKDGGTEPLGKRIIELPQDQELSLDRDPHSGTIAYVPSGAIERGKKLVTTGAGKTTPCATCHGPSLSGLAEVPMIAGDSPLYIVRQLLDFQTGVTAGTWPELMKGVVAHLDDDDVIAIAAYVASQAPASPGQ